MWISNLLGGAMMLFFGFIVRFMKASGLIAGYNTMSKEEKAKYDEEKLTRFVGDPYLSMYRLPLSVYPGFYLSLSLLAE